MNHFLQIFFDVTDKAGNEAETVSRKVRVLDNNMDKCPPKDITAPVIEV